MKKVLLLLFVIITGLKGFAQQDPRLRQRLDSMLRVTEAWDLEKILDFTYVKLFILAPRDQMLEAMKSSFESEEFTITPDSVRVDTIFPMFSTKEGQYVKIRHTMLMRMKLNEVPDSTESADMVTMMEEEYGEGKVRYDKRTNTIILSARPYLVAIKDDFSPEWTFVNYNEEGGLAPLLFSKEVIEKLKEYN
ncbi:MAG: hypothetical protein JNM19_11825 [Chitinophagaceae bacterium]|nr:hypothetical protein [Chitinophagaceae bacterium]